MPTPISDLPTLLRSMAPVLNPGAWAFVSVTDVKDLEGIEVIASIREPEGLSAVISEADAAARGIPVLFRAAWITLRVHSDLAAVGLTAAFSAALAETGIGCNVVAGAYHDHIFVPVERAAEAMTALARLQRTALSTPAPARP